MIVILILLILLYYYTLRLLFEWEKQRVPRPTPLPPPPRLGRGELRPAAGGAAGSAGGGAEARARTGLAVRALSDSGGTPTPHTPPAAAGPLSPRSCRHPGQPCCPHRRYGPRGRPAPPFAAFLATSTDLGGRGTGSCLNGGRSRGAGGADRIPRPLQSW